MLITLFYICFVRQRTECEVKDPLAARKVQKADREKLRRDKLNEVFNELGNTLGKWFRTLICVYCFRTLTYCWLMSLEIRARGLLSWVTFMKYIRQTYGNTLHSYIWFIAYLHILILVLKERMMEVYAFKKKKKLDAASDMTIFHT